MRAPRVVKLGGSLLDDADWPRRLRAWLADQAPTPTVLIVGGGRLVDVLRDWHAAHRLGETRSHWLAIRAMSVTARVAHSLLPDAKLAEDWTSLRTECDRATRQIVFDPLDFLLRIEPSLPGERIHETWDATSDSIAARVCVALGAQELVLLKSCAPPVSTADLAQLAELGYVDRCFPTMARGIELVSFVKL